MNQTIDISRIQLLFKLHFTEHGRSFLMAIGLSIGAMLVLMLPILFTDEYSDLLYTLHVSTLLVVMFASSLVSSTTFNEYKHSSQGIPAIMLPASRLEKFLVIWLSYLFFIVLIIVIFYTLHHWVVKTANLGIAANSRHYYPIPQDAIRFFSFSYFIIQGWCFLGSMYFNKNALLMSLGSLTGLSVLAFGFNLLLAYQFTGLSGQVDAFPFTFWNVFTDQKYYVAHPEPIGKLIKVFLGAIVLSLWCITYVRLKEKEI